MYKPLHSVASLSTLLNAARIITHNIRLSSIVSLVCRIPPKRAMLCRSTQKVAYRTITLHAKLLTR